MSVVGVTWAVLVPMLVLGLFKWHLPLLGLFFLLVGALVVLLVSDFFGLGFHFHWVFLLFIISEVALFVAFLHGASWFYSGGWCSLSDPLEVPLVGCFLLLGSSISLTGFHHVMSWEFSWVLLSLTAILGLGFVSLQLIEFSEDTILFYSNGFYSACLATVGLHFSHVLLGVVGMLLVLRVSVPRAGFYYCTLLTWYWHFVDYVWLLVYSLIYVC
uniref:Cytochrome c oxidase subunit 3 n=1 Tax=Breviscolex orientalis TaxID=137570 RepID=A0A343ESQ3_9CEST|nr:cytochrome c oxidase subunit 3 [Breviscolex orientalis]ASL24589.1 cytochrome c oxidase subunit 3 [Breviscolex orientalis]